MLQDETGGYRRHPQLKRFQESKAPLAAIAAFLEGLHKEATSREYRFKASLIANSPGAFQVPATQGQLMFEWGHLLAKMEARDKGRLWALQKISDPKPHPLFQIVPGGIAEWERP